MTITLTEEFTKAPMARSIPGAYFDRDDRKAWVLTDPTPRAAAVALRLFPGLAADHPELCELRDALHQEVRPFDNASEFNTPIGAPRVRDVLGAEGIDFYEFQALDLGYLAEVLVQHQGAYMGWERGLGKTLGAAALIDELMAEQVLVVCPNTAKLAVWGTELRRFCPWLEVVVLRNNQRQRNNDLGYVSQLIQNHTPFALVVHYEALAIIASAKAGNKGWDRFGTWHMVIADESHRIANPKTKMAKALKKIPSELRLALSGSIIQNHAEELFSPLQWLHPQHYRSKWRDWNDRFLDFIDSGYGKICAGIKIESLAKMREELGVFMVYRRKEDELDLPERTEQQLLVELSPAQRKAYLQLQEECLTKLSDDTTVKAADGLVMLTRLRQIATGLDLLTDEITDSTKLDLAIDLIEDNEDEAFVVFSWYKAAGRSLAHRLTERGTECFIVDGDVKHEERAEMIARFQAGERRVFIGTLSTLGESVTLHRATNAIFIDRSWNPATNAQAADRIYRIGQSKPVLITHIVAKDTVDELRVLPALNNKEAMRRLILGG